MKRPKNSWPRQRALWRLVIAAWLGGGAAAYAAEQSPIETARTFAPMVWLGPSEIAYPTLPHPFAFDRIDNDEDGCTDLDDADEIQALVAPFNDAARRLQVEKLLIRLRELRATLRDNPQADLSREVPQLTEPRNCARSKPLSEFKLCRRSTGFGFVCGPDAVVMAVVDADGDPARLGLNAKEAAANVGGIYSVQYWMYYPWDGGHLHDGEHASVFYSGRNGDRRIRALVGAGHLEKMANNVLVAEDERSGAHVRFPESIPPHVPVLSELGKHASAPDFNCNGRFDPGFDANDLASGAWGTRDVNHAIGKGSWAKFESWTSFDRRPEGLLIESSALQADASQSVRDSYAEACPPFSMGHAVVQDRLKHARGDASGTYRLVLADTVKRFLALAAGSWDQQEILSSPDYRAILGLQYWEPLPSQHLDLKALKAWADDRIRNTNPRPDVWNHRDFADPKRDFRLDLFPKLSASLMLASEGGNHKFGAAFRIAGWGRLLDSSLELQVLADNVRLFGPTSVAEGNRTLLAAGQGGIENVGKGHKLEAALHYNAFSTGLSGPYLGISWRGPDYTYERVFAVPNGVVGADSQYLTLVERSANNWNLEAGYSYRAPVDFPVSIQLGITGPVYRGTRTPSNPNELKYYQYASPLEVRVSIKLGSLKLIGRNHPLGRHKND